MLLVLFLPAVEIFGYAMSPGNKPRQAPSCKHVLSQWLGQTCCLHIQLESHCSMFDLRETTSAALLLEALRVLF